MIQFITTKKGAITGTLALYLNFTVLFPNRVDFSSYDVTGELIAQACPVNDSQEHFSKEFVRVRQNDDRSVDGPTHPVGFAACRRRWAK